MMITKTLSESILDLIENWNEEFSYYPLTKRLVSEKLITHQDVIDSQCYFENEKFIGAIVLKKHSFEKEDFGYISFIYVQKDFRHRGYGKRMLQHAFKVFKNLNISNVFLGTDYGCLFSGLFVLDNNQETHDFFLSNGFEKYYSCYNLDTSKPFKMREDSKYSYQYIDDSLKESFKELMEKNFDARWYDETINLSNQEIVVVLDQNKVIGFSKINTPDDVTISNGGNLYPRYQKLGSIGPLGIDSDYRGQSLGYNIVAFGVNKLFEKGCSDVLVDWTGHLNFYQKVGFTRICDTYHIYKIVLEK